MYEQKWGAISSRNECPRETKAAALAMWEIPMKQYWTVSAVTKEAVSSLRLATLAGTAKV